tara:strand:- start:352 stop:1140 length:789 start_codon:yes stop_codon:yes gene_type:complete
VYKYLLYKLKSFKNFIVPLLANFPYRIIKRERRNELLKNRKFFSYLRVYEKDNYLLNIFDVSTSQFYQDLFVLSTLGNKRGGFFIEMGACDGIEISNTFVLEKYFNWGGILVEPSKTYHKNLKKNRNCKIDFRCVYNTSGEKIIFNNTRNPSISTIDLYSSSDRFDLDRYEGKKYSVETITLDNLLKFHNAPKNIDYLSLDTEGSEYEILKCFNFDNYKIKIITVEHNYTKNRELIYNLLISKNYERVFKESSKCDDFYILK